MFQVGGSLPAMVAHMEYEKILIYPTTSKKFVNCGAAQRIYFEVAGISWHS